jgi:uncharacterized protein YjbI with pentapeptide repeats
MNNIIELKFEPIAGDAYHVELRGGIEGKSPEVILTTQIPAFDPNRYYLYQQACRKLYDRHARIGLKSTSVITAEDLAQVRQNLDTSAANLLDTFNRWGASPQLAEIARAIADRSENLRVTISTECTDLRRLPFHQWQLFPQQTEAIFSGIEAKVLERTRHPDRIRILIILGDKTGIDIEADRRAIASYCQGDAELVFLTQPTRAELTTTLADALGWDIIFFSGHSDTEGDTGRIYINATDSLTMVELKDVLKPAIEHRVQIAIFNSCDGLGITPVLEKLNIDRLIVMREPIPDLIAQEFLKSFLKAFTGGARFDNAVKSARQQLVTFEDKYPYVSWLPVVIQNRLVSSPTWQSLGKIRSPYKGLEAFTEADAGNFYGREETIERYAQLVASVPLVPIIGASGSGKSSLVQAGLIPFLKQDTASDWQILTMRPGRTPFKALAKAIFNAERANIETIELDIELAGDRQLLTQKLAQIRIPHHRILLFIDQFEELFTQSDDEAARQVFLQSLADAVSNAPNFVLVFTLRNDFLPTLQSDRQDNDFRQVLERYSPQLVGSMNRDRLKAAITKPVEQLGVEFEGGLVDRLIKDVGMTDGSLPMLQLVLELLWETQKPRLLTNQGYDKICDNKGISTALAKHAEELYSNFVANNKVKQFNQVFFRLIRIGGLGSENTRRIATRAEIGEDSWREVVVPLATDRLLVTNLDRITGVETVEIIHEALLKHWRRIQFLIDRFRNELAQIEKIEMAAKKWQDNNNSKQLLWQSSELKDMESFINNPVRLLSFTPVVYDHLNNSKIYQVLNYNRMTKIGTIVVGISVGVLLLIAGKEILIFKDMNTVASANIITCNERLSTAIKRLLFLKPESAKSNLANKNLSCIDFQNANLQGADLTGTKLQGINLINANLQGANLQGANLRGALLMGANLRGADLSGALLQGAMLNIGFHQGFHESANLQGANLHSADLQGADLQGANLHSANLHSADLQGADLQGADLTDANLDIARVKLSKNFWLAQYSPEFKKRLRSK